MKRLLSAALAAVLCLGLLGQTALGAGTPSAWAQADVNRAIETGLVPENLQDQYTQTITRAEFTALVVALYEKVTGWEIVQLETFQDTGDENVRKAAGIGVVTGVGGDKFDPNGALTREQGATMLTRLADAVGAPLAAATASFADNSSIASWALEAAGQVQAAGVMSGSGDNRFMPQDPYTREQSILTILRLYDVVTASLSGGSTSTGSTGGGSASTGGSTGGSSTSTAGQSFREVFDGLRNSLEGSISEIEIANALDNDLPSSDTFAEVDGDALRAQYPDQSLAIGYLEAAYQEMINACVRGIDIYFYKMMGYTPSTERQKIDAAREEIDDCIVKARDYLQRAENAIK